jgi:hypothetical protein
MMRLPRRLTAALPRGRQERARSGAIRTTLTAVLVALAVSALATTVFTVSLGESLGDGLLNFATFGGLAALTAGVLAWELAASRACPRCRHEQRRGAARCTDCGYDLSARRRYACSEGHAVAYEPGMCDCGRRLLQLRPVPVVRHAMNTIWLAMAVVAALAIAAVLSALLQ